MTISSIFSLAPNVAQQSILKSAGHHFRVASSLPINMLTITSSPLFSMDPSCQVLVRTNPCAGAPGSPARSANQGKETGTPPRIACPSFQIELGLRYKTSTVPLGIHEVTCAPCRYISPSPAGTETSTFARPPLPGTTLAAPAMPNRRSISDIASGETKRLLPDVTMCGTSLLGRLFEVAAESETHRGEDLVLVIGFAA